MAGLARRSLATIVTFVLLAAVGFTLGALAGVLWEQPRLILSYLTGGTTEIAWRGDGETELPDVAAAPAPAPPESIAPLAIAPERTAPPGETVKPDAPAPKPERRQPPPPPAPAAPVVVERSQPKAPPSPAARPAPAPAQSKGRFAIQVGAFGNSESAERLASRLEEKGYDAYVTPGAGSGNARWRVRVGPLADKATAETLASRLKKNEKLPTWILDEAGS